MPSIFFTHEDSQRLARLLRRLNPSDPADRDWLHAVVARLEQTDPPTKENRP